MKNRPPQQLKLEAGAYIELIPVGGLSLPLEDTVAAQATMDVGNRPKFFTYGEWLMRKREKLDAAYRNTIFRVCLGGTEQDIRVSKPLPTSVAGILDAQKPARGAYLTAYNPGSRPQSQAENDRRHQELVETLRAGGLDFYEGEGIDGEGEWTPEPSFLIVGIEKGEALSLATDFGQYSFVYLEVGKVAELVYTTLWDDL